MHDSKALCVPYTEMVCRLWFLHDSKALFVPDIVLVFHENDYCFLHDSKALFVPDIVLVFHENEYCFCMIVKHCLCLILYLFFMKMSTVFT